MLALRALVVSIGLIAPTLASAQSGPLHGACQNDIKAMCGSVQPGGGRIRECMKERRAQLSVACKLAIADRMLEHEHKKAAGNPTPAKP
jgi:hypothetical protein